MNTRARERGGARCSQSRENADDRQRQPTRRYLSTQRWPTEHRSVSRPLILSANNRRGANLKRLGSLFHCADRRLHPYISRGAWDDKGGLEYNRLPYCFITVSGLDWQHTCLLSHPNISTQAVYDAFTLFGSHACCVCSIKQTRRIGVPSFTFLIYSDDQLIYGDWFYWYECYK